MSWKFDYDRAPKEYFRYHSEISKHLYPVWAPLTCILIGVVIVIPIIFLTSMIVGYFELAFPSNAIVIFAPLIAFYYVFVRWIIPATHKFIPTRRNIDFGKSRSGYLEFNEKEIIIGEDGFVCHIEWYTVDQVFDMKSSVGIFRTPFTYVVPNEDFASNEDREKFIAFCKAQIAAHKEG